MTTHDNGAYVKLRGKVAEAAMDAWWATELGEDMGVWNAAADASIAIVLANAEAFWREHPNASLTAWLRSLQEPTNAR